MFENMASHLDQQKSEVNRLRHELQQANRELVESNREASLNLAQVLEEEQANSRTERENLMSQIRSLMEESSQRQSSRLRNKVKGLRNDITSSADALEHATSHHDRQVDEWIFKEEQFGKDVTESRNEIKTRMRNDWEVRIDPAALDPMEANHTPDL